MRTAALAIAIPMLLITSCGGGGGGGSSAVPAASGPPALTPDDFTWAGDIDGIYLEIDPSYAGPLVEFEHEDGQRFRDFELGTPIPFSVMAVAIDGRSVAIETDPRLEFRVERFESGGDGCPLDEWIRLEVDPSGRPSIVADPCAPHFSPPARSWWELELSFRFAGEIVLQGVGPELERSSFIVDYGGLGLPEWPDAYPFHDPRFP